MSTMICKVLGYGLTDLQHGDDRMNWESPLLDFTAAPTFTEFADHPATVKGREFSWLEPAECVRRMGDAHPHRSLDSCVVHNAESGSESVLVLVPPSRANDWSRSDDTFDYLEAHFGDEPDMEPVVRELRTGITPFDGLWMDRETGAELHKFGMFRRLLQSGDPSPERLLAAARSIAVLPNFDADETLGELAAGTITGKPVTDTEPLFHDADVAEDRLVRLVPAEVRELASFGHLFTDPDTWKSLVPVHYTYWS
ncbi:hypothetical protein IV500_04770 [Paeniglutamicibacter antarcticus]|uniref:Uncharacterized protein n=1 Tax=Arthrobacter terrae TaxID=2935737 RepID=A0A931G3J0_9MICC|nr:hypothetical protein [Arthrobacter terrae]MBG0738731.1 hypothetical protein [Arthrobacter terrae]